MQDDIFGFSKLEAKKLEKNLNIQNYKCRALINKASGTPVLFLHGLSYTSEVWRKISIIDLLTEKCIPFLALDMPYGLKSQCEPKTRNPDVNLTVASEAVKALFGSATPVVVGASLGGYLALKYAAKFPVKALLVVAPARSLEADLRNAYERFSFPVRVVWGSYDSLISGEEMRALTDRLPNAKMLVYEGAAHSAYQDKPERFQRDLLELYAKTE